MNTLPPLAHPTTHEVGMDECGVSASGTTHAGNEYAASMCRVCNSASFTKNTSYVHATCSLVQWESDEQLNCGRCAACSFFLVYDLAPARADEACFPQQTSANDFNIACIVSRPPVTVLVLCRLFLYHCSCGVVAWSHERVHNTQLSCFNS